MILPAIGQTSMFPSKRQRITVRLMVLAAMIVLLVPVTNAQFYVKEQQYRFPINGRTADCTNEVDLKLSYSSCESRVADHHDFSMNFIEVKDDGSLWDRAQLKDALERIDKARFGGKQKPIVFIYIHGWHNNAKERDSDSSGNCTDHLYAGDVAKFRNCGLPQIAEMFPATAEGAPPRVVGIYLAWHGNDFNWIPFNIVPSYPFRRYYARKVGQLGMANALQQIVNQIDQSGHREDYFVITMGHSFGSRVLENATENIPKQSSHQAIAPANDANKNTNPGVMKQYRAQLSNYSQAKAPSASEPSSALVQTPPQRPPLDLIFHVNAASSHSVSRATIKDWKNVCALPNPPPACTEFHPIYFAVSSRADVVTAVVMPIANIVFFSPITDQYHLIATANTPWMQTHRIPERLTTPCEDSFPKYSFCFSVYQNPDSFQVAATYEVRPKGKENKDPGVFWAMNSDHWIAAVEAMLHSIPLLRRIGKQHWLISSHGDVWNPGVFGLVQGVIEQGGKTKGFSPNPQTNRAHANRSPR